MNIIGIVPLCFTDNNMTTDLSESLAVNETSQELYSGCDSCDSCDNCDSCDACDRG